jgi:hypothetical protein
MPKYKLMSFDVPSKYSSIGDVRSFELPDVGKILGDAESSLNALAEEGWRVVNVQALTRGEYGITPYDGACVAYSVTDSILVVLEKE